MRREEEQARSELRRVRQGAIGQVGALKAGESSTPRRSAPTPPRPGSHAPRRLSAALDQEAPAAAAGAPRLTGLRRPPYGRGLQQAAAAEVTGHRLSGIRDPFAPKHKRAREAQLKKMLAAAEKRGDDLRVKVIQNRLRVVRSR